MGHWCAGGCQLLKVNLVSLEVILVAIVIGHHAVNNKEALMDIKATLKFVRSTKGTHYYSTGEEPRPKFTLYVPKSECAEAVKEISMELKG